MSEETLQEKIKALRKDIDFLVRGLDMAVELEGGLQMASVLQAMHWRAVRVVDELYGIHGEFLREAAREIACELDPEAKFLDGEREAE